MQESYLTQALIADILIKNKFLVMFQNDERMRSGRFTQPTIADISIEWLIQAYLSKMQKDGINIYLIPIAINYDRLFEMRNLAEEIIGNKSDFDINDIQRQLRIQSGQKVGKVYMTFGEAISMKDYLT